ncbi:hypothetical protein [Pseudomonas sp. FeS53a]|uniref:hypothetical protein n=1 Tax=Pseudomonas sp. FeS53a TaxID=1604022 RepID=UPI0005C7F387|nr:hypothetical protein [Pseudomonas sp. FeS53a]
MNIRNRLIGAATLALLAQTPQSALAADWWVIFGTGDSPERDMFYADALSVAEQRRGSGETEAPRSVGVVQVLESAEAPNFVHYSMQFQCRQRLVKFDGITAYMRSNTPSNLASPQGWKPVPQSWVDRAYTFACDAQNREGNAMLRIGNTTADVLAQVTRTQIWGLTTPAAYDQAPGAVRNGTDGVMRDLDILLGNPPKR